MMNKALPAIAAAGMGAPSLLGARASRRVARR